MSVLVMRKPVGIKMTIVIHSITFPERKIINQMKTRQEKENAGSNTERAARHSAEAKSRRLSSTQAMQRINNKAHYYSIPRASK